MRTVIFILLFSTHCFAEELIDRVIISVSGQAITERELRDFAGDLPKELSSKDPKVFKSVQDLVFQRLLDEEASRLGVSVSDSEIEAYIKMVREQNSLGSEEDFAEALKAQGLNIKTYKKQIRTEILRGRVLSVVSKDKILITEEEVDKALPDTPDELTLVQYLVPGSKYKPGLSEEELKSVSIVKDLGAVNIDELRRDIADSLAKPGELGAAVKQDGNYYFYVREQRNKEKERERIKEELFQKRYQEAVKDYLARELPERYDIQSYF